MPIEYKTRKQIQHKDIQNVLDTERKKGWTLIDIEEGSRHRENDLIFLKGHHEDIFGKQIADGTTNESNLASHYPYTPERWRLFKGSVASGNRLFPEYDTVSEYAHLGDVHELRPAAGETIIFETAERYRYVVANAFRTTWALQTNQALTTGDYVRVGLYDGTDGYFLEHNGSHGALEAGAVMLRDGTEVYRKQGELSRELIYKTMIGLNTAWYDVTGQHWYQSFAKETGEQENVDIGSFAPAKDKNGPKKGNLNLRFEVKASATTTGLTLQAGSVAYTTLGSELGGGKRRKGFFDERPITETSDYEPLAAFRGRAGFEVVNSQLGSFEVLSFTADSTIEIVVMAFDETKVTFGAGDWENPSQWNTSNNALEYRTDVDSVADNTGTLQANPATLGGYQIGQAILTPVGGSGSQFQKGTQSDPQRLKRNLNDGDIAVILAKTDHSGTGATGTIGFNLDWEQDF